MRYYLVAALAAISFLAPSGVVAVSSSVTINEVLFDPAGIDTGFEYVSIKNTGSVSVDVSGWELYPDGVGYFTFPPMILNPGVSTKIFIHGSGTNTNTSVYFPGASGNMGNSSGSVTLFSSHVHSSSTIVSYVRYHKRGSGEHKTWESTAAHAGLWPAGSYVDIMPLVEGQSIVLTDEGARTSPRGWGFSAVSHVAAPVQQSGVRRDDEKSSKVRAEVSPPQEEQEVAGVGFQSTSSSNRLQPVIHGSLVSRTGALLPFAEGGGIAFLGTLIVFVIKTLFQRYNKTNGQKQ